MALPPELVLVTTSLATSLHEIISGSTVLTFKQGSGATDDGSSNSSLRRSTTYVEASNGVGGLVMSLHGAGKGAVNVWSFAKESAIQRCLLPTRLTCLALSKTGNYLVGGTDAGRLFLWETGSGSLLTAFDAHYRGVTCLAWTQDDDGALLSGSEDASVHCWSLASLVSLSSSAANTRPSPYASLRDHTLPVTDIAVGRGRFPKVRCLTSSTDGSCKIWDLAHASTPLLSTFTFPAPFSAISHVALDPLERFFFAAAAPVKPDAGQGGLVRRVDLYRKPHDEFGHSTVALGGGGRGESERVVDAKSYSSSSMVTALHLSTHSPTLLLGLQSGQVLVLSLPSLQLIRTILPSSPPMPPVIYISSFLRPPDLVSRAKLGSGNRVGGEELLPQRPFGTLGRTIDNRDQDRVVQVRLHGAKDITHLVAPPLPELELPHPVASQGVAAGSSGSGEGNRLAELQAENAKLREQLGRAIGINDAMWKSVVDGVLSKPAVPSA